MHLTQLTLDHYRSYSQLAIAFEPGLTLILGGNATGKSNLLEAIALLATLRAPRATTEGDLIAWDAPAPPLARVAGLAQRRDGPVRVEVALVGRTDANGALRLARSGVPLTTKRVRRNGLPTRPTDAVGAITAVLFSTTDIELVTGSPGGRRRFLDAAISQGDRAYARALGRYDRALTQRNALFKRIARGQASAPQLAPWDDALLAAAAPIVAARWDALQIFAPAAARRHAALLAPAVPDALAVTYHPALGAGGGALSDAAPDAVRNRLQAALAAARARELAAATTLVGPHRDDLVLHLDGRAAAAFGSRAQQRSVALALRLAEADFLRARTGEAPIMLLDDVFSELDPERRAATARALAGVEQVILTSADPAGTPPALPTPVATYRVADGVGTLC